MKDLNRAAVVVAVLAAGVLTVAQTGEGGVMSSGLVRVSDSLVDGAQRTVSQISSALARFFGDEEVRVVADVEVRVRTRASAVQETDGEFSWSGVVATGESIEVKGVNGSVIAELASGPEVEVRAEKTGRRSDPDDVRIEVIEHSGGVTLCAVYPSSEGRQNTCEAGSGGRNSVQNNDVQVTFYVKVPEGVVFTGRTVNGDVEVNELASDVTAVSVNGDIEVTTTGFAEASTVNGSIEAEMGSYDLENGLRFSTVNGSISLDLPDDVDANVDARWVNGELEAESPLALIGRLSRRSAQGVLGEGGPELNLETVNGSIRIH